MMARKCRFGILALFATVLLSLSTAHAATAPRMPEQESASAPASPCDAILSPDIVDLVKASKKDPAKALEKKRKQGDRAITPAAVQCASSLWKASHPPAPRMSWAQRRAAARAARAAQKARIAEASRKPKLSRALSAAGTRALSRPDQSDEAQSRPLVPVVYAGPFNNPKAVAPILAPPLRGVQPIPPPARPEVQKQRLKKKRPPAPIAVGGPDGFRQTFMGPESSAPDPVGVSFDGIGVGLAGFNPSSNPPDVNGAVGATQYVQWNNSSFAVFSKTGTLLFGPAAGNTLFQALGGVCASHNDGDPVVNYDRLAGRWVLSQFVVEATPDASHQCVAVSATDDALGAYYLYDFVTDPVNFVDYPHMAVWPDGYYMSSHIFNSTGTAYLAGRVHVFEREKMLLGLPARQLQDDLREDGGNPQYGFLPADLDSLIPPPAGAPAYLLGPNGQFTNQTDSTRVAVTWGVTPTITLTEDIILGAGITSPPCVTNSNGRDCVPQPSPAVATDYLDNIEFHYMFRVAYRNFGGSPAQESLVISGPTAGSVSTPGHGAIKWIEFRNNGNPTATPTVFQQGTFDPDTAYRWIPSIAMDKDHNIAVGYSKSSLSIRPGIYMTGRLGTDPLNTMGAETTVMAGIGSQQGGGNRWGDYSAMTLDPIDQCTFWYTNEYLKTNGAFNWSTRIAAYKFPSCTPADAWGTISGTITSCATGAPLSGILVTLSNGFAGTSDASGNYSILVPAGTYSASASGGGDRNCTTGSPATVSVISTSGGTTDQDFCMSGDSKLEVDGTTIDDATNGNNNGVINRNECVKLNVALQNNGCANETAISGLLTTSTPNVTITQNSSAYPNLNIDASGNNTTPFQFETSNSFVCGTTINFSLALTYAGGNKVVNFSLPTCAGPDQTIPSSSLGPGDLTQTDRLGRDGTPSTCAGNASPGGGFPGTKFYKTFTFTNTSTSARCFTVNINAALGGAGDIESAAYSPTYNPANINTNYLGDSGVVGLGTTVGSATYSFTVPGSANFVIVVNTTGTTSSSVFTGTVSGFIDNVSGPGACPTCTPPPTPTVTPGGPTTFCPGGSVTLTSSSASAYQWYNGLALIPGATNQNYVATTSGSYNVVVTENDCPSAHSASVTVNADAPVAIATGTTAMCVGASTPLSGSANVGPVTCSWAPATGLSDASSCTPTASPTSTQTYTLTVTDGNGCVSTNNPQVTVTVSPVPPTPTITPGGPTTFCAGGSVTLTSDSATGNQWYRDANLIVGATNQQYVATQSGAYTVIATPAGCASAPSTAVNVTVNPLPATPSITPGGPTTFCAGGSVTLTSTSASSYQWSLNGNPIGGATNQQYVATATGAYTVVISDGVCNSAPSTAVNVTVNPIPATPTITPAGPTTFCQGASVNLSSSSASGNQWYRNGTPLAGQTGQIHVATLAGNYTVVVTTNGCSSAASAPVTITVNPKPDATITVASPMFSGSSATASVAVSCTGSTFSWSITGGTITSGNGTPVVTFTAGAAGTLTLQVTVTNSATGCSDTKSANVTVQVAPFGATPYFRATASGTTNANLEWAAVQTAVLYEVQRSTNNSTWVARGASSGLTFSDSGLSPATTYYYRVRPVKADTTTGPYVVDPVTTVVFTDEPLSACGVFVKAVHIMELRNAVNIARASLGMAAATFTDPALTTGSAIKAVHITELRTAIAPVLSAISVTPSYTDPTVTAGVTAIKGAHVRQLRDLIK